MGVQHLDPPLLTALEGTWYRSGRSPHDQAHHPIYRGGFTWSYFQKTRHLESAQPQDSNHGRQGAQCNGRCHFATNCLGPQACKQDQPAAPFPGTEPSGDTASSCLEFCPGGIHPSEGKKPRVNQMPDSGETKAACPPPSLPRRALCMPGPGSPQSVWAAVSSSGGSHAPPGADGRLCTILLWMKKREVEVPRSLGREIPRLSSHNLSCHLIGDSIENGPVLPKEMRQIAITSHFGAIGRDQGKEAISNRSGLMRTCL